MAGIMGLFASELDKFVADYDNQFWDASFHGETYPPRIIMERSTPPLYRVEDDGSRRWSRIRRSRSSAAWTRRSSRPASSRSAKRTSPN